MEAGGCHPATREVILVKLQKVRMYILYTLYEYVQHNIITFASNKIKSKKYGEYEHRERKRHNYSNG